MLSWSSGKDSAWALQLLRRDPEVELAGLFTTVNREFDRVAMHAVRRSLLEAQAKSAGLPLSTIPLPYPCPNVAYEAAMAEFVKQAKQDGVTHFAFGDLYLEDVRRYRAQKLAGTGIEPLFPLWGLPTRALAREMVGAGLRAVITCVDPKQAPREWAGRPFDIEFLDALPEGVDFCGEYEEFHTFAYDGSMFRQPVIVTVGEIIERDGRLLIARRGHDGLLPDLWEFPGGKVEPGESHSQALARELAEELGVEAQIGELVGFGEHEHSGIRVRLFGYRAVLVKGEPALSVHQELRWAAPSELSHFLFAPADRSIVEAIQGVHE